MNICDKCGLDHHHLGVSIHSGLLSRKAYGSRHMLRSLECGPAWAFVAPLLDKHPEVDRIMVIDQEAGAFYRIDRHEFDKHAQRITLHSAAGEQLVLPVKYWRVSGAVAKPVPTQPKLAGAS